MIQQRGALLIGTKDDLPGVSFLNPKTNAWEGFSVDLGNTLAQRIFGEAGHLQPKPVTPATRVPTIQEDTVDMNIETTFITQARKEQVDFADPYWGSGTRLFVLANNDSIHSPSDLDTKTVATTKGSTGKESLKDHPSIKWLEFDTNADSVEAVRTGRAVATDFDEVIGLSYQKNNSGFKFVGDPIDYFYYGIMVKKGQQDWVDFINQWEKDIKADGTWKRLYAQNFPGVDVPEPPQPPFDKAFH